MSAWLSTFDDTNRVTVSYNVMIEIYQMLGGSGPGLNFKRTRTIETIKYVGVDIQYGKDQVITLYEDTSVTKAWLVPGLAGSCAVFKTINTCTDWEDVS